MPANFVKDVAKQTHHDTKTVEHTFKKVEQSAKKSGATNPYAVATSAVEKAYGYTPKSK